MPSPTNLSIHFDVHDENACLQPILFYYHSPKNSSIHRFLSCKSLQHTRNMMIIDFFLFLFSLTHTHTLTKPAESTWLLSLGCHGCGCFLLVRVVLTLHNTGKSMEWDYVMLSVVLGDVLWLWPSGRKQMLYYSTKGDIEDRRDVVGWMCTKYKDV